MVIRREDFHLELGAKETFRFQPAGSAAGIAEYVLVEKLPSSIATVFRQSVKFDGNNLPDLLVSVSEDAISARTADLPPTQLLVHWPLPLRAGQTYEYTSPAGRVAVRIEGPEEITVPAGTFRCLVCVEQVHAQDRQWENRIWHAPNTGVVKMVVGGPNGFTSNLIGKESAADSRNGAVKPPSQIPTVATAPTGQPFTNSLGMKFVPVPGTSVLFSIWDTRVQDYEAFVAATGRSWEKPKFEQGPTHPVAGVSWHDAKAFCSWLTEKERRAGTLKPTEEYRLPTDLEWSTAVGLNNETGRTPQERDMSVKRVYPWGTQWPPPVGAGNYGKRPFQIDDFEFTSPVGSFAANRFGLYDMGGNVWQWCEDWYNSDRKEHVMRGGSWGGTDGRFSLSSSRRDFVNRRSDRYGFRCVLAGGAVSAPR